MLAPRGRGVGVNEPPNGGYRGDDKSASEIRNKAKDAIVSLLPYEIGYQQYLAEGVREDTLRSLYHELRLEVPPNTPTQGANPLGHPEIPDAVRKLKTEVLNEATAKEEVQGSTSQQNPHEPTSVVKYALVTNKTPSAGSGQTTERDRSRIAIPQSQPSKPSTTTVPVRVNKPVLNGSLSDLRKYKASEAQIERKELIRQKLAAKRAAILPNSTRTRDPQCETESGNAKVPVVARTEPIKHLSPTSGHSKDNRPSLTPSLGALALESDQGDQPLLSVPLKSSELSKDMNSSMPFEAVVSDAVHQVRLSAASEAMDAFKITTPTEVGPKLCEEKANHIESFSPQQNASKASTPTQTSSNVTDAVKERQDVKSTSSSFSGIPGLFMTSPNPQEESIKPTKAALSSLLPQTRIPRKRPVAADFDTEPPPMATATSFKRPFGHSRLEQPLVINVSDDESADDDESTRMDVDIDQSLSKPSQSSQAQGVPEQPKRMSIRDMPPLTDIPVRRGRMHTNGYGRTSTPGTPSMDSNSGKSKSAAQEVLKRKEEQIQVMQKKIAEHELRKALASKSRADTPVKSSPLVPSSKQPDSAVSREASVQAVSNDISTEQSRQAEENAKVLAAAKAVEDQEAEERRKLIQAKIEERNRRRAQIQSDLSQTKAEVEKEWQRLEELREEEKRRQTTLQEASSKKLKLEEELQKLEMEESSSVNGTVTEPVESNIKPIPEATVSSRGRQEPAPSQETSTEVLTNVLQAPAEQVVEPVITSGPQKDPKFNGSVGSSPESTVETMEIDNNHYETGSGLHIIVPLSSATSEESNQGSLSKAQSSELPEPSNTDEKAGSDVEMTEPPPTSEPILLSNNMAANPMEGLTHPGEPVKNASVDPTEEGEIEEGLSTASPTVLPNGDGPGGEEKASYSNQISDESDSYEPPEPMPADPANQQTMIELPFSPVASQTTSAYSPTLEGPSPAFPDASSILTTSVKAASNMLIPAHETNQGSTVIVDIDQPLLMKELKSIKPSIPPRGSFKPYVSPLRQFRSYRYHPQYLGEVSEGFRSLTFSHKIDLTLPLCTYEVSGGICNDNSCGGQHFRDMGLSDDRILAQIVSVREGSTMQEESQYMDGLRQALKELRVNKVKDISTVASKIAAYRSTFLKDPSRVLMINNTSNNNPQKTKVTGQ
ncbi:MAG: hypothetical protein M1816_008001 [Peltula sp. TS41687]|nr:MAG: hypothetical protein M1816_008001 [Peltula sp. TS41687]